MTMYRILIDRAAPVGACALIVLALAAAGCDTVPLTAPTNSTVTVTASTTVVPAGGTADVSAFVAEPGGTPVQNGTTVRFTTNLGRVDPVEVQTRNGLATTTFRADENSGVAEIRATSGGAGGGSGATATNVVQISVGSAAVDSVTLRASPASVPSTGGTVELVASVIGVGGRALSNVPVSFAASEGQLVAIRVLSDTAGEARTQLTTDRTATVTATAGTKTSPVVTVVRRDPPPTPNASLAATSEAPTSLGPRGAVTATAAGPDPNSLPSRFDWDFGDGTTALTNGNVTAHVFTVELVRRVVSVKVTLSNGQTLTATTEIIVGDFP